MKKAVNAVSQFYQQLLITLVEMLCIYTVLKT